jgi:isopenicillin N synthase-like dioxygenase
MLSALSDHLDANKGMSRLENFHRPEEVSDSGLKLIYEPSLDHVKDVVDNLHTDSGTFTLLFYDGLGLEAELLDQQKWAFTPMIDGCALINVADSLQRLSDHIYHSPQHRVTQPFDGFAKRYYISYFLRPEQSLKDQWAST